MKENNEMPIQPENREESKPSPHIFLDIGSGVFPTAFYGNREFKGNDYYIGVDINRDKLNSALSNEWITRDKENFSSLGQNVLFIEGSAGRLPFAEGTAEEVFMGNVLGESAIHYIDGFIPEIHRVLKEGGVLVILETTTPSVALQRDSGGVDGLIERSGFKKIKEIRYGDPEFEGEIRKYAGQIERYLKDEDMMLGSEFIAYFQKDKDSVAE